MAREREKKGNRPRPNVLGKALLPRGGRYLLHDIGRAGLSRWDGGISWRVRGTGDPWRTQRWALLGLLHADLSEAGKTAQQSQKRKPLPLQFCSDRPVLSTDRAHLKSSSKGELLARPIPMNTQQGQEVWLWSCGAMVAMTHCGCKSPQAHLQGPEFSRARAQEWKHSADACVHVVVSLRNDKHFPN